METGHEFFAKRYNKRANTENLTPTPSNVVINLPVKKEMYHVIHPYHKSLYTPKTPEEPIDLTQGHNRTLKLENNPSNVHKFILRSRGRRSRRIQNNNNLIEHNQLQGFFKNIVELQATETKQAEILKAAKSLFSKRTRTLYHWMYPNANKQQIKMNVANSWDTLSVQEKQFYISQVLVRFGFPQCNLMVNPQLGGIKELPPLPDFDNNSFSASELQNAISSISNPGGSLSFKGKRPQGRPLGSKNKKRKADLVPYKINQDFQDDPELSNELEKFAVSFDCLK